MYQIVYLKNSLLIFLCFIIISCKSNVKQLPYYNTPDFSPIFIKSDNEAEEKISHKISDFIFTNQNGNKITQKNIEGKIHVANFFFISCQSICPKMTNNMKKVNSNFANDSNIVLLSYSVTPWIDSVNILKAYANSNNIGSKNWHLLTGDKNEIYTLARKSYFAEEDIGFSKDSSDFLHTEHFILVDKEKRIRGIYNGTLELEIQQLIKDINLLKQE